MKCIELFHDLTSQILGKKFPIYILKNKIKIESQKYIRFKIIKRLKQLDYRYLCNVFVLHVHVWSLANEAFVDCPEFLTVTYLNCKDGSPGLVVMDNDSCSRGHGFESRRHILDRHYLH